MDTHTHRGSCVSDYSLPSVQASVCLGKPLSGCLQRPVTVLPSGLPVTDGPQSACTLTHTKKAEAAGRLPSRPSGKAMAPFAKTRTTGEWSHGLDTVRKAQFWRTAFGSAFKGNVSHFPKWAAWPTPQGEEAVFHVCRFIPKGWGK